MTIWQDNKAGSGMVLTKRDAKVVSDVADFRFLSREQLQRLGHFRSKTRANAVLLRLVRFGYLSRRYQPAVAGTAKALYLLGPVAPSLLARSVLDVQQERKRIKAISDLFLAHQLLLNDVRIKFQEDPSWQIGRWLTDTALRQANLGVIPDGYVEYTRDGKQFSAFVELDRGTETLTRWQPKAAGYLRLATSGQYRQIFGHQFFRVLAIAPSEARVEHLRTAIATQTDRIFWFATLQRFLVEGPFSEIWLRPQGAQRHSLTEA